MSEIDRSLPRRTVLQGAGIGIGAGLLSGLSTAAQAQTVPAGGEIWHQDYWAKKGDVKLNLWRKRIGWPPPRRTGAAGRVPGARIVELGALLLRPHGARQGRILAHERAGALRL